MADFLIDILHNEELRKEFKSDPRGCLKKNGIAWEDPREIIVYENKPNKKYFVLRLSSELNDEEIAQAGLPDNLRELFKKLHEKNFREQFKKDPKRVLQSFQIDTNDKTIEILEDTDKKFHIILNDLSEIDDRTLSEIVGGGESYLGTWGALALAVAGQGTTGLRLRLFEFFGYDDLQAKMQSKKK